MTFLKELIFIDKQSKFTSKGKPYLSLRTEDNFFLSCFKENILDSIKLYCPIRCVVKLDGGSRNNNYNKSLILLGFNKSDVEFDNNNEFGEIPF